MTDKETRRLIEEKEARERVKRLNAVIGKVLAGPARASSMEQ